jgi:hypothetical protein
MKVEKSINTAELTTILKNHFEKAENMELSKFAVTDDGRGNHTISYETGLIKPTTAETLQAELGKAKDMFTSIFGRHTR